MSLRLLMPTLLLATGLFAQNGSEVQSDWNRIFAKHFTFDQLSQTFENSPEVYNAVEYYFKESFTAHLTDCESCPLDLDHLLNYQIFDVYQFESQRLDEQEFELIYRDYTITLLPKNVVYSELAGMLPTDLVNYIAPRDFPSMEMSGDLDAAYLIYKEEVYAWAKDFPSDYRTLTNSPDLLKISIRDLTLMDSARRSLVLNHDGGYLIID